MKKRLMVLMLLMGLVVPTLAFAQGKYDIKEMTPEVLSALEGRRDRYDQLQSLKDKGLVGEGNGGYVVVLKDESNASSIVTAENADRKKIYVTIAKQNNLEGSLDVIEKVFAQVQREKAQTGDHIQTEGGDWIQK